jgi:hypothetical protein
MSFDIVTYCGANFAKALEFTFPSWVRNSGAERIIVYTDVPTRDFVKLYDFVTAATRGLPPAEMLSKPPIPLGRQIHAQTCSDSVKSWDRKIDVLEHDFTQCRIREHTSPRNWIWLDSDCFVTKFLGEVFNRMGNANVAATRAIGRTIRGRGQANAGVIPFRYTNGLEQFFKDWRDYAVKFRGGENAPVTNKNMYYEQTAFSHRVLEAFDDQRPYLGAVISENIWNCEEDSPANLVRLVEKFQPRVIHFKGRRWEDKLFRNRVLSGMRIKVR